MALCLNCGELALLPAAGMATPGVTEVLGSDCQRYILPTTGFASGLHYAKTASLAVPYDTFVAVTGWTMIYDNLAEFNPATGVFTAIDAGKYLFSYQLYWAPVTNTTGDHQIHLNAFASGWKQSGSGVVTGGATNRYSKIDAIFDLVAGGTVALSGRVDFGNATGGTIWGNGGTNLTYLQVQRIA